MNRNNKEIAIAELTAEAMKAGWSPKGKSPKRTLSSVLHNEIRRRGSLARFAKGSRPGMWKLSTAGVHYANEQICMALLATEPDTGMQWPSEWPTALMKRGYGRLPAWLELKQNGRCENLADGDGDGERRLLCLMKSTT